MRLGASGHFERVGIVPRAIATVAVWSIAAVVTVRLEAPLAGLALGAIAVCMTIVIWLTPGRKEG